MVGAEANAAAEATFITAPDCARRIAGTKTWQPWTAPHRLVLIVQRQSSIARSPMTQPPLPTPALLTSRSAGAPKRLSTLSDKASTCSSADTSQPAASALPPVERICSAVTSARWRSTSAQTTAPPRREISCANARPIPLPAPVTTAREPATSNRGTVSLPLRGRRARCRYA
jgi:hypothetical protein